MGVLVNPFRFGGTSTTDSFVGYSESTLNSSAYTFTDHAIGVANAARLVVVGVILHDSGSDNGISSVTIGASDDAMTQVENTSAAGDVAEARIAGIYSLVVAAGTTATIKVNCSNTGTSCGIAVWSLYPSSTTPIYDVSGSTGASTSLTATNVNTAIGGTVVAIGMHNNSNTTSWAWPGTDSESVEFNENIGDSGNNWSALTIFCSEATSSHELVASWTSSVNACLAVAAWGA
jgi:hypothetical protein